jgi:HEAT repeats
MSRTSTRLMMAVVALSILTEPCRLLAQAAKEAEIRERIQQLEKELAELRGQLERLRGKEPADIVAVLDQDYQDLLKKDRQASFVQQAAQHLLETNRNTHWHSYITAMEVLRKHRAQASVPLIVKYMMVHPAKDPNLGNVKTYLDTLVILTGEDVKGIYVKEATPENFAKNWWLPRKDKITVDMNRMNRQQLERVLAALLAESERGDRDYSPGRAEFSTYELSSKLSRSIYRSSVDRPAWYENEIHPAMLPILLERCGVDGGDKTSGRALQYHVIPMLAQLRKDGEAPNLDAVAKDRNQPATVRMACLLANHVAGEDIATEAMLELYTKEKNLEIRLAALLMLPSTVMPRKAAPQLLEALDDPNAHIRSAAVIAMASIPVPGALPKLAQMLEGSPADARRGNNQSLLRAVAVHGSAQAKRPRNNNLINVC